ncbi:MAG: 50S ribosomal protein L18 [Pseudomonadales bacterium]|nr:50S ribosomal protein L18 [Candidatus Woesebacteria bacterium]MCB9801721.1 50S ribosomal protein L18 [Pseudomonadales bacterium]
MAQSFHNLSLAARRKRRVRAKMKGTALQPRVSVHRTNKHIYVQAINDVDGVTLAAASDLGAQSGSKSESAVEVAKALAQQLKKQKIKTVMYDRGQFRYHGRVKVVAETLRQEKIKV